MSRLRALLDRNIGTPGSAPGAVALIAHGNDINVETAGFVDLEGSAPMERSSIFRIASVTKPIVAAAMMTLIDDGLVALDDHIDQWVPEVSAPMVVREPGSPVDDVVPIARPITIEDVLSSRAGWGFPAEFDLPAVSQLFSNLWQGRRCSYRRPSPTSGCAR